MTGADEGPGPARPAARVRARRLTLRRVLLTVALLVWVPGCAIACWWQITVALSGDALADLYSVEWPVFAIFGVVAWWRLIHDEAGVPRAVHPDRAESGGAPEVEVPARRRDEEDEELARYNDYLAELSRSRGRKTWRRS